MNTFIRKGALLIALGAAGSVSALPVIERAAFYTESWESSVSFPTRSGDYLHLYAAVSSPDVPELVSAVATQGDLIQPMRFFTGPIFLGEKNFELFLRNTSRTGAWDLTVTDSSGSATGVFPAIANPQILPFLENIQVMAHGLTPTVTWELPDLSGFDVDAIRVRAVESETGRQIFQSDVFDPTSTSFTFGSGVLSYDIAYEFRLLLDDFDGTRLENRSNTFSSVYTATVVPEPSGVMLMLAGVGLLGVAGRWRRNGAS